MKYIMFRTGEGAEAVYCPIIFPDNLVHKQVASRMKDLLQLSRAEVVSAGEIVMFATSTSGASETLGGLQADENDRQRINCINYSGGMDSPINIQIEHQVFEAVRQGFEEDPE